MISEFTRQDHIFWGAFLHDIGKLFERGNLLMDKRDNDFWKQEFCPKNQDHGYYTHLHVLNTDSFNEHLTQWVGALLPTRQLDKTQKVSALDHWMNYAAKHHEPSLNSEKLVALADRLASTEREPGTFYTQGINKKARLEPIVARTKLCQTDGTKAAYRMPLKTQSLHQNHLFAEKVLDKATVHTKQDLNEFYQQQPFNDLTNHYQSLGEDFFQEAKTLCEPLSQNNANDDPHARYALAQTLLSLFEKYLANVPSATNTIHPDISLFDHLKITGAIAETLYVSQPEAEYSLASYMSKIDAITTEQQAFKQLPDHWRLVCCDFSGIQKFIYGIVSKGAAKSLRGRSLFVQLLCDAVADYLLKSLQLYPTSKIYASGGKFYLLVADRQESQVYQLIEKINQWLLKDYQGSIHLACGIVPVTAWHFKEGNMGGRWEAANRALHINKQQKYRTQVQSGELFKPDLNGQAVCQVTGYEISPRTQMTDQNGQIVHQRVKELSELGQFIKQADYLLWDWGQQYAGQYIHSIDFESMGLTVYLLKRTHLTNDSSLLKRWTQCVLETINEDQWSDHTAAAIAYRTRLVGRWMQSKTSGDWEFDDFAQHATGIQRLGILRMDVDNLGQVFIRGLKNIDQGISQHTQKELGSLSRMTALSRQLNYFFSGYLNTLLANYERVQIIYAGGDDIFLIGSWDSLLDVAYDITQQFYYYTCTNPCFSISGGLATVSGKFPIAKGAQLAGDLEAQAKQYQRHGQMKNAFAAFETIVGWEQFEMMYQVKQWLNDFQSQTQSSALLQRLRQLVVAIDRYYDLATRRQKDQSVLQQNVYWQQYRWRLIYNLTRLTQRYPSQTPTIEALQQFLFDETYRALDWLKMPVCWHAYEQRQS